MKQLHKTPFPWFGGKADAAPVVWAALGDVLHYAEPFAGSLAVLLRRPHEANRSNYSETVNDLDGLLVNAWRGIQLSPAATAAAASWPVSEADLCARQLAIVHWRESRNLERLMADPDWHDPKIAGWWLWGISCWIGSGWCSGRGRWVIGSDGRLTPRENGSTAPGVTRGRPHLNDNGFAINRPTVRAAGVGSDDFHDLTMPNLLRWFRFLSARLRHCRILNGDWSRLCKPTALRVANVRLGRGVAGVFLDPPYKVTDNRAGDLYNCDNGDHLSEEVRRWCIGHGHMKDIRIVLAGFEGEHHDLAETYGWREIEWFRPGLRKGGLGNKSGSGGNQQARERLWLSPSCLDIEPDQMELFPTRRDR